MLFAPTLAWLCDAWITDPYYSHGLLVPLVGAWLVWRSRRELTDGAPDDIGLVAVAIGVFVHIVALRSANYPLSAAAGIVVMAGLALLVGGRRAVRACALAFALLVIAIPVPIVEHLAPPMAAGVAHAAAGTAESFGVAVERAGAQLTVADGTFVIGAPCSGLRSLVALVTLAVLAAGISATSLRRRLSLPLVAVVFAVVSNWLRVTSLIVVVERMGVGRSLDWVHAASGLIAFGVATLGLLGLSHVMGGTGPRVA